MLGTENARQTEQSILEPLSALEAEKAPAATAVAIPFSDQIGNTLQVIESIEQGVIVWSADGVCLLHNQRMFDVLELSLADIYVGMTRKEFLTLAKNRGEFVHHILETAEACFQRDEPFTADRKLPSGRVVATTGRPMRKGGFVVSYTDVTEARQKEKELAQAKMTAEAAENAASSSLNDERARKHEARMLSELGEWLQSCKSLEELFDVISRFMAKLFEGSSGELYIYSNSRDVLDGSCSWNSDALKAHIQPDDCWALRRGRMYKFGAGAVNFTCNHVTDIPADTTASRYICVPIIAHGDTVGLLHIRFDRDSGGEQSDLEPFDEGVHRFAIQCSEQISLAIANVKLRDELRDQSTKDPLTGLYNRRYFLERCRTEIGHASRYNHTMGLISLDADNFKMFNDNHGHDAGDIVLRTIAELMTSIFVDGEVVSRFGGEEFSILLPEASRETAMIKAEQLRLAVEQKVIRYGDKALPTITISIGVAMYPAGGTTPLDLLKVADDALYAAKDSGKNCVVLAGAENSP